jgi:hypothetical protein
MITTADEIKALKEMLGLTTNSPKICRENGCYNIPARGYVICIACLHGIAQRADEELVRLKKKLELLQENQ